jgi:hypothetical protein
VGARKAEAADVEEVGKAGRPLSAIKPGNPGMYHSNCDSAPCIIFRDFCGLYQHTNGLSFGCICGRNAPVSSSGSSSSFNAPRYLELGHHRPL